MLRFMPRVRLLRPRLAAEAESTGTSGGRAGGSPLGRTGYAERAPRPAGAGVSGGVRHRTRAGHGVQAGAGKPAEVIGADLGVLVAGTDRPLPQ